MNQDDLWATQPVAAAREYVRQGLGKKGVECPCCGQICKLRKRSVRAVHAKFLIRLVAHYARETPSQRSLIESEITPLGSGVHFTRCWRRGEPRDYANLGYFGLMLTTPDGVAGRTTGLWYPTPRGIEFVRGRYSVPSYAAVFNNTVYDWGPGRKTITDVLKKGGFRYEEVCESVGFTPSELDR